MSESFLERWREPALNRNGGSSSEQAERMGFTEQKGEQ